MLADKGINLMEWWVGRSLPGRNAAQLVVIRVGLQGANPDATPGPFGAAVRTAPETVFRVDSGADFSAEALVHNQGCLRGAQVKLRGR